jgi:hypothetical protein
LKSRLVFRWPQRFRDCVRELQAISYDSQITELTKVISRR